MPYTTVIIIWIHKQRRPFFMKKTISFNHAASILLIITSVICMEPEITFSYSELPTDIWHKIIAYNDGMSNNILTQTCSMLNKMSKRVNHHIYVHSPLMVSMEDRLFGLFTATYYGNAAAVENLLQHATNSNYHHPLLFSMLPLDIALTQKNNHLIALLKKYNAVSCGEIAPMYVQAIYMGDLALLDDNLESLNDNQYCSYPLLHIAIPNGHTQIMERLLQNPTTKSYADYDGLCNTTPLYFATKCNRHSIVQLLLDACPQTINHLCYLETTALHIAVEKKYYYIAETLCNHPLIKINLCDIDRNSPLHTAVKNGDLAMVKLLLSSSAIRPNIKNNQNETPLDIANKLRSHTIKNNYPTTVIQTIIKLLINKGAKTFFYLHKIMLWDKKM